MRFKMKVNEKKIYDVSMSLTDDLASYPGDEKFQLVFRNDYEDEIDYAVSSIHMSCHNGTHIDAPYHFNPNGLKISEINEDLLIGKVYVSDVKGKNIIDIDDIPDDIDVDRIIFKTSKKRKPDSPLNPHLSLQATLVLVDRQIRLVGINQMSIEKADTDKYPVHKLLTKNNIFIIENLVLNDIKFGYYRLICAPLKIYGAEAAPCRVFLEEL